jgi:hypothetical protein
MTAMGPPHLGQSQCGVGSLAREAWDSACAKVTIPGGGFKTRVGFCRRFEVVKQLEGRICGDKEKNSE